LYSVFEMFIQIEKNRSHAHGGLGIGLALSKTLIEMHDGLIVALGDGLGKGSLSKCRYQLTPKARKAIASLKTHCQRQKSHVARYWS